MKSTAQISIAIANAVASSKQVALVVTEDPVTAINICEQLEFFVDLPVLHFSDLETLAYDSFSPHKDLVSERIGCLYKLSNLSRGIIVTSVATIMQRLAPTQHIFANSLMLKTGDLLDLKRFRGNLDQHGYSCVSQVMAHGEFAVRGSIIDLFPMGSRVPYRIDLFDNEIDSIRTFNPNNQLSIEKISEINILPAKEFPVSEESISIFRNNWREYFSGDPLNCTIYKSVSEGILPDGIEYYLPLFFPDRKVTDLFSYLPDNIATIAVGDLHIAANNCWNEIKQRFEQYSYDATRPLLECKEIFLPPQEMLANFNRKNNIDLTAIINTKALPENLELKDLPYRLLFTVENQGRRETIKDLLRKSNIFPRETSSWRNFLESDERYSIVVAPIDDGFVRLEDNIAVVTEQNLLGVPRVPQQRRRRQDSKSYTYAGISSLNELELGAPVVHIAHGVGRYCGLTTLDLGDITSEFVTLEYADGDKLYVPVTALDLISNYSGADIEHTPLHKLGSKKWNVAKEKALKKIRDKAAELLDIYAKREVSSGKSLRVSDADYNLFASDFNFVPTVDQQKAIEEVREDLQAAKKMDRLVCGDVGFGKTEIAMRAAFIALSTGGQVAVLVPTTLLAQQHFNSFKDRFANFHFNIEMLSRFYTAKKQNEIIASLAVGKVDLVIGTHKLLGNNIKFKDLKLVVVDEEHRFGVTHKEKLKALRSEVDLLTLTATPIPRTLNMAMSGVRDLSIIATPPAKRLAIKTFVRERNNALIIEAISRELHRGGQVYFVHNKVETIEKTTYELQQLLPDVSMRIAHGQMRERELEQVMADFYHHKFSVLVCTTIIETGIDIPAANTILLDRADRFGLAQLHQLRGRVGRSHHQAYAFCLTPSKELMTSDAIKRLDALANLEDLGSGFILAMQDLEIRGAGELLGAQQSGHIQEIGFSLYTEMLQRAVKNLKSGRDVELDLEQQAIEVDLGIPAIFPNNYILDVNIRLVSYKRLSAIKSFEKLDKFQVELIDRFGLLPEPALNLFLVTKVRIMCEELKITKLKMNNTAGKIDFASNPNIDTTKLLQLVQSDSKNYQFLGPLSLKFQHNTKTASARLDFITDLLNKFKGKT